MKISEKAYSNAILNLKECKERKTILTSYPLKIYIEPTIQCNLNCEYCYSQGHRVLKPFDMDIFYSIEKQLFEYVCEVNLFLRGEPTLYKDFPKMLDVCSKYPFITKTFSNLSYSNDSILRKMVEAGVWLNCSFDGLENSFRTDTNYEQVLRNIKFIQSYKEEIKQDKFHLRIASVIGKNNIKSAVNIIEFAESMGIREVMFGCLDGVSNTIPYMLTSEDAVEFSKAVNRADQLSIRISTPTHIGGSRLEKSRNWEDFSIPVDTYSYFFCEDCNPDVDNNFCPYPWIQTIFQVNKIVTNCCQRKQAMGSLSLETDFMKDIWNNQAYQKMRGIENFNTCSGSTCNMMKYSIWGGERQLKKI